MQRGEKIFSRTVVSVFLAWFAAQGLLKTLIRSISKRNFYWRAFFEGGGMPSGHSALVAAISTAAGMVEGFGSMVFYVSLVFSFLVIYETLVTKNAVVQIISILSAAHPKHHLAEKLGHTFLEVVVGCVIGIGIVYLGLSYF